MSKASTSPPPTSEEVQAALRRCWQPVARVDELREGPQRAILLGEALAVFLTESGVPAVVADRCPHRGASLALGEVCGEALQCAYHGWQWDGRDGTCVRVPSLPDQSQIPPRARVASYPAREQWGLVWTSLEEPLGKPPRPAWFDTEQWNWKHGTPFHLPVSFGVMIENFRDVAHFAFVHRETLGSMPEVIEPLEIESSGFEVIMRRKMTAGKGADDIWGSLREVRTHAIAPNFTSAQMFNVKGQRCLLHAARAINAVESMHYWIEGVTTDFDEYSLEESIESDERLYAEDREIIATIMPPGLSLDPNTEVSTLADRFTLAYRLAFAEFVRRAQEDAEPS